MPLLTADKFVAWVSILTARISASNDLLVVVSVTLAEEVAAAVALDEAVEAGDPVIDGVIAIAVADIVDVTVATAEVGLAITGRVKLPPLL